MHTHREKERIWAEKIKRHWHHFWYIGQQNERNDPNVHIFQSNTIHCVRIRSNFTVNIWSEIILLKRPVLNVNHVSEFFPWFRSISLRISFLSFIFIVISSSRGDFEHMDFWILNRILCQFLITRLYKTWESGLQMSRFVALVVMISITLSFLLRCHD